jgi:hypothetical protein
MKRVALALSLFVLSSTCTAYKAQHTGLDANTSRAEEDARLIPPDAKATAAFDAQPLAMKQATLISEIDKYRDELKANGKYDCCVKPACRQCAMSAGECHCRQVIDKNGPCCGECTQSWIEGKGNTAGVDREKVLEHLGCVRELYEKKVPDGVVAPGKPATEEHQHE